MLRLIVAALAAALMLFGRAALAAPADELRALLEGGRSAEAYALGRNHPEELGKPDFDFYYGIAAVDSGHAGEGVLALERYIIRFPDNDRARLELARGYFVLGELVRAREEFETVSRKNPPPAVQATIDRFMDSIRAQETRYSTTATGYVEIGGGYDSNVNSGVGNPIVTVPTLGTVQLSQNGVKSGSSFLHLGAGGQVSHPIAPGVALLAGVAAEGKLHSDSFDQQFDQTGVSGYGGASYLKDKNLYRATLAVSSLYVDYNRFRDTSALGGEWHHQLDEFNTLSLFGQYARLEYPAQAVRDADFYGIGAGWRRAFVGRMQPVFQLQALYGQEKNDASPVRDDLSRDIYTVRGGLSLTPAPQWGVSGGLTYTKSRFQGLDPLFTATRDDDYYGLELGASYRLTKKITLRGDYQRSDNRSNIVLYGYKRDVITLRARYEF
ncbi:MAG: DUF560 domain-containing protein [Betaproteobacteria bacterium]|nr:MAG: DUF560 domain-containing protein [Betaproteobacteria bacterium]